MFAAIYDDTPPHGVDRVITSFPCSTISPQRSLCSAVDDDDDISSHWSLSPGPPSPRSVTSLQRSLSPPHDSGTGSSVDGGCSCGDDTSSQWYMSPGPPSPSPLLQQHHAHHILLPVMPATVHHHTGL